MVHSLTKFDSSPDLGKLKTTQLELLLQSKQAEAAKQLVEQSIIGQYKEFDGFKIKLAEDQFPLLTIQI